MMMMKTVIFCGPTLAASDVTLEADVLPPARQGDLYRAARQGAHAIGLIDGYFDQVNSVAHKEILWAMANGVHVFGAASMGALRAAELEAFGMEGVGTIFNQFRSGVLEDDDEVAVAHAAAEDGYRALSEAMVNVRATFAAAARQRVISDHTRDLLIATGKALLYMDRSFPLILARAEAQAAPRVELQALCTFLPTGRVDQKRTDALALIRRMREHRESRPAPKTVKYFFSHTDAWEALRRRVDDGT
jgi:hypothetical protein